MYSQCFFRKIHDKACPPCNSLHSFQVLNNLNITCNSFLLDSFRVRNVKSICSHLNQNIVAYIPQLRCHLVNSSNYLRVFDMISSQQNKFQVENFQKIQGIHKPNELGRLIVLYFNRPNVRWVHVCYHPCVCRRTPCSCCNNRKLLLLLVCLKPSIVVSL